MGSPKAIDAVTMNHAPILAIGSPGLWYPMRRPRRRQHSARLR